MNIKRVIEESRKLLNEVSHNINQDYSDSILDDSTILMWINRAIRDIEFKTGGKNFTYEDTEFNISIIPGQELYNFPLNVDQISNLMITNGTQKYYLEQYSNYFTKYNIQLFGIPKVYALDYKPGVIKLFPTPSPDLPNFVLKFTGRTHVSRYTMKDIEKELPYDDRFHDAYIYYVCYSYCSFLIDADNTLVNRGKLYKQEYDEIVRYMRNYITWRNDSGNSIRFDNGDYQT